MTGIENLQKTVEALVAISSETQERPTNWRGEQASLAFAKLAMTCLTILKLTPGSTYFAPANGLAMWDVSAIASQTRNLIEAYYLLCYLIFEPTDPAEREFRKLLWDFHEAFERNEMLSTGIPDSKNLPVIRKGLEERQRRLEASPVFAGLSTGHREQLLKGKKFKLESAIELSRKAGISERFYRSNYKYLSTFAHSSPFAISQLREFRADSPEAKQVIETVVNTALPYSLLAIREFTSLFPDQLVKLNQTILAGIHFWEEILKWEKSEQFNSPSDP